MPPSNPPAFQPLVERLAAGLTAEEVFWRLSALPHCLFLDSAARDPILGRYSFVAADPFDYMERMPRDVDSLGELARRMAAWRSASAPGLPPFQGGAAGLFGYELGRQLERLPAAAIDEFGAPALAVGFYDVVIAFDHAADEAWIISQGLPETDPGRQAERAGRRLGEFVGLLASSTPPGRPRSTTGVEPPIPPERLAPQFAVAGRGPDRLTSTFSEAAYLRAVERAIEYIHAGDVFQVNLSQRLLHPAVDDSVSLYLRLRHRNQAPFAGYFDLGDLQVLSASPERFLKLTDRTVETRPIKGTRSRPPRAEDDDRAAAELLASEKDRAENVMIVDLLRNDLSRVCGADSVVVEKLCGLESFPFVHHLVSVVGGELRQDYGPLDLLGATFPGGSITGAPKIRAMEIIAELEPTARGPYCGSLGYLAFDGQMDLNILIRTITAGGGWWQAPVGGGIVAQSDPRREYEETWHKAEGLMRSLL